jgi:hypothetical protein
MSSRQPKKKKRYRAYHSKWLNSWYWFRVYEDGTLYPCGAVSSDIIKRITAPNDLICNPKVLPYL